MPWPPVPTHGPNSDSGKAYSTVRAAISDLASDPQLGEIALDEAGKQDLHFKRTPRPASLERYRVIPPGGNRFDLSRERPERDWSTLSLADALAEGVRLLEGLGLGSLHDLAAELAVAGRWR